MDDLPLAPSKIAHFAISQALNHTPVNFGWQLRLPETREPFGSALSKGESFARHSNCFFHLSAGLFGGRSLAAGPAGEQAARHPRRPEERRVGKECASTCSSRWSPEHSTKNKHITTNNKS